MALDAAEDFELDEEVELAAAEEDEEGDDPPEGDAPDEEGELDEVGEVGVEAKADECPGTTLSNTATSSDPRAATQRRDQRRR